MFQNIAQFQQKQTIKSTKHPGVEYELIKKLGQGAEGAVYSGINLKNSQKVAIKILNQMTENEKKSTLKLAEQNFEHIINIYDLICQPNQYIVIMEFADGELYSYISQSLAFAKDDRKTRHSYFLQIIEGVKELHSLDLIHRDLKPENVVYINKLGGGKILKLCDFGLVKEQNNSNMTKNIGTPYYQAPELLIYNNYVYTNKIDIWALGMMWYELLSGTNMMEDNSIQGLQNQIRNLNDDEILRKIPKVFKEEWELYIIKRMVVINPAQRMSSNELYKIFKECFIAGKLVLPQPVPLNIVPQSKIIKFLPPNPTNQWPPKPQPVNPNINPNFPPLTNFPPKQVPNQIQPMNWPQKQADSNQPKPQSAQIEQKINEDIQKEIQQKQQSQEFKEQKKQFEEQFNREKEIELKKKLEEAEEEAKRKLQLELLEKEKLLQEERKKQEKELEQLQNANQEYQQKMFELQMNYNNEMDEFKKKQEKEAEQKAKESEEKLRQQMQQQLLQEVQEKEKQLKQQIEKEIVEQKNKEYNEELKKREQEQIRLQQQILMENKGIVLNFINISSDMLENYLKSLQQKKADSQNSTNGAEYQQYNQQIELYIKEATDEIALLQTDLAQVQNLNPEQSENGQVIANYLAQYQQFSANFSAYQNEKNSNLAQIYQNVMNRKSIQEQEKARQLTLVQQQQQNEIQQLRNQFNQKLDELNKMNQYYTQQIQGKELLFYYYEPFDNQQQLSQYIKQGKQELNYFTLLNQNFVLQTEDQQDNVSQIQSLQFKIQQLNNQVLKFKELPILLENFARVQVSIEQDLQITKKKQIDDVLEQIELEIQAFQHQDIQESKLSQQVSNLIQSIQEKISHLEQIKSQLSKINLQINPTTINQELQFIKEKKNSSKQYFVQLQKMKEELDRARAYETLLNQLNSQKQILIGQTQQRLNQQVQIIQNQINLISKLVNECQFNLNKSGIHQKIYHLQLINNNFHSKFQQITMVQDFTVQSEFEQFKQDLEKFVEKNQEIVRAEENSVKDLKNVFQQLMQKEQNESEQLFSQAQMLYESITQNIQEYQRQFDQFQSFPQIPQLKDNQIESNLLAEELKQLQQMQQDGIKDSQIIKQLIQDKNKDTIASTKDKSLDILNNLQRQLIGNTKLLEEKLGYFNSIHIPTNTDYQDLQQQIKKFEQDKEKMEQYSLQLKQNFTKLENLKGQINENLKLESNKFIQFYIQWESQDKTVIEEQINNWKKINLKLNKQLEFYIITKMIVNLMKLYNARRYAQRLQLDLSKAKKMAQAQESKFKDKSLADNKKYQEIINQEQQINTKYKLWLQTNQIMNLAVQNILKDIQDERQQADGYIVDLLNTIKQKNLVKLRKALKENIQSVAEYFPKLEFLEGQIYEILNSKKDINQNLK